MSDLWREANQVEKSVDRQRDALLTLLLAQQDVVDGGAMTTEELSERIGVGVERVRKRLKPLVKAGLVKCVRVQRVRIDGCMTEIPAYYAVPESDEAEGEPQEPARNGYD